MHVRIHPAGIVFVITAAAFFAYGTRFIPVADSIVSAVIGIAVLMMSAVMVAKMIRGRHMTPYSQDALMPRFVRRFLGIADH